MKNINWYIYGVDKVLRNKFAKIYKEVVPYSCKAMCSNQEANSLIMKKIESGEKFFAGRLGFSELAAMRAFEFQNKANYELVIKQIYEWSGFFPNDSQLGFIFLEEMVESVKEVDYLACSEQFAENYFMNKYMGKDACGVESFDIMEPWRFYTPWSAALKGKKVLVVTPFDESVRQQYALRDKLFEGTDILPEFELVTYKSLQTTGDLTDERFDTWFEALEYMYQEIEKIDFDIALLGCGAYGFPLGARIKKAGKQAIHMGGVLQILFGIMGKRWDGTGPNSDTNKIREDIAMYYNNYWTYPKQSETPTSASRVEYGPYWK